jgi:hypothetical protein
VPAHADLYFRRFNMGSQLAGIYLAGTGVVVAWKIWWRVAARFGTGKGVQVAAVGCFTIAALAWTWPAAVDLAHYDHNDATTIETQRASDTTEGAMIAPLIEYIRQHGGGRVYAGLSSNWGQKFLVGYVPVYKYLVSQDVDEMTYVVPTTSLMLGPEAEFDEDNPADYALFGIRYLLLPAGLSPVVPAQEIMSRGAYSLWQYSDVGYAELVQVTGRLTANRSDIGTQSQLLLDTLGAGQDWSVEWPGLPGPSQAKEPSISPSAALPSPGIVENVGTDLDRGELSARVTMTEQGTLLFSVAYDPGWHAWVDGRAVPTEMLAPALLGVHLTPGRHQVVLRYIGFGWYPELWAGGLLSLVVLGAVGRWWYKSDARGAR